MWKRAGLAAGGGQGSGKRKVSQKGKPKGGAEASPHWEGPPQGLCWALRPAVAQWGEICIGRTGRRCSEVLATRSPTCRLVLEGLLLRPVHLPGPGAGRGERAVGCPPKGRGCWASRTKAGGGRERSVWLGLMALKKKKT